MRITPNGETWQDCSIATSMLAVLKGTFFFGLFVGLIWNSYTETA